jgi:hypothetical protein
MFYMVVGVHIVDTVTPCRYQRACITRPHNHRHTNSDTEDEGCVTSELLVTSNNYTQCLYTFEIIRTLIEILCMMMRMLLIHMFSVCMTHSLNCLRSLGRWDRGFESRSRHGCLMCMRLFCVCVVLYLGSGLETG